jgi:hypothetical protein
MKKSITILLCFILNLVFAKQPNSEFKYIFQLEKTQQKSWNSIEKEWFVKVFNPYVKKFKIKISDCQTCGNLYIDFEGKINNEGKLLIDESITKKCGKEMKPKLEKQLLDFLLTKTFPKNLRNIKIQHRLGTILKC